MTPSEKYLRMANPTCLEDYSLHITYDELRQVPEAAELVAGIEAAMAVQPGLSLGTIRQSARPMHKARRLSACPCGAHPEIDAVINNARGGIVMDSILCPGCGRSIRLSATDEPSAAEVWNIIHAPVQSGREDLDGGRATPTLS